MDLLVLLVNSTTYKGKKIEPLSFIAYKCIAFSYQHHTFPRKFNCSRSIVTAKGHFLLDALS